MENEIWKDVVEHEGLYQVSNIGRVKSLNYNRTSVEGVLIPCKRMGYPSVVLHKNGKRPHRTIHSLVAESFIDSDYKSKGLVVNHIDFVRDNNNLKNLELVTTRENTNLKHKKHSSIYTGVCWNKRERSWESRIVVNKKQKYLGKFKDEKEASLYYENALMCIKDDRVEDIKVKIKRKASKYKGVAFVSKRNNWRASFSLDGKRKYLGSFKTEEQAYMAICDYQKLNNVEF